MRKFVGALVLVLILGGWAQAEWLGVQTTSDNLAFPVMCLDADGNSIDSDSVQVVVWHEDVGDNTFTYEETGAMTVAWIAELTFAGGGDKVYYFRDAVADIDGAGTDGAYTGVVYLWSAAERTPTYFSFYLSATNTNTIHDRIDETISTRTAIGDTNKFEVTDFHLTAANIFDFTTDEVSADVVKISGLAAAADNLELMFDADTTNGPKVDLQQLTIYNGQADEWAIRALNNDNNTPAVIFQNNSTGEALDVTSVGNPDNDVDIRLTSANFRPGAIDANALAASAVDEIWDEPRSGHTIADTYGAGLDTVIATVELNLDAKVSLSTANDSLQIRRWVWDSTSGKFGNYARAIDTSFYGDTTNWAGIDNPGATVALVNTQIDADAIAFSVWNMSHDTTAHFHDSAFGARWHDWAANAAAGTGAIPCTIQVVTISGADTAALQGAYLRVYNSDETATVASGTSDANGRIVFSLEAETFHVYGYQGGYSFAPLPDTVVVPVGGITDTLWGTPFDPGSPANVDLCRVYGWVDDLAGAGISGASIRARVATSPLRFGNLVVSPYKLTTTTDSTGYWFLDVIPSGDMTPDTTSYQFEIRYGSGAILRRRVVVPDSAQWFFTW